MVPFCQTSTRSRSLNSSVIMVEKKAAMNIALADADAEIGPVPIESGGRKREAELDRLSNILKTFEVKNDVRSGRRVQAWCPPLPILRRLAFRRHEDTNSELRSKRDSCNLPFRKCGSSAL